MSYAILLATRNKNKVELQIRLMLQNINTPMIMMKSPTLIIMALAKTLLTPRKLTTMMT